MPYIKKLYYFILLCLLATNAMATKTIPLTYYKKVAISQVFALAPNGAESQRILISEYKTRTPMEIATLSDPGHPASMYVLGKPIWQIDQNLPLTEMACIEADAALCTEKRNKLYRGSCFKPCLAYGPEFLDFNEKTGMIYFVASSASIGTGGGPYFVFAGDINTKKIEYLQFKGGPFKGSISPGNEYLALFDNGQIEIYDMKRHESFIAVDWHYAKEGETDFRNVFLHWNNNSQFGYQVHSKNEKKNFKQVREFIYDVSNRKPIDNRITENRENVLDKT